MIFLCSANTVIKNCKQLTKKKWKQKQSTRHYYPHYNIAWTNHAAFKFKIIKSTACNITPTPLPLCWLNPSTAINIKTKLGHNYTPHHFQEFASFLYWYIHYCQQLHLVLVFVMTGCPHSQNLISYVTRSRGMSHMSAIFNFDLSI